MTQAEAEDRGQPQTQEPNCIYRAVCEQLALLLAQLLLQLPEGCLGLSAAASRC